jgi:SAM-dependent methyltransferase
VKNAHLWTPTKFIFDSSGHLRANPDGVPSGSFMIADLTARWWHQAIADRVAGDVLDIGCGLVPLYEAYSPRARTVTCLDWNENQYLDAVADLNYPIELTSASFDSVILSDVLEHVRNPETLLAEVFRLLRPGGVVLVNTPFFYWLHEEPHDYCRYTEFWLCSQLEQSGFSDVTVEPLGGYAEVATDLIAKGLARTRVPSGVTVGVQRLALRLGRTQRGSAVKNNTASKFPLSYGTMAVRPSDNSA